MAALLLVQRGELDLERPIAHYWPEFAQNGKADIPVKMVLNHQVGLPYVDKELALADLLGGTAVAEALAAQAPVWQPGSTHGYHGITIGYLLGELVRRVSGRTLGRYFAEEIAAPLGLDFFIGLPAEHEPRVTRIIEVEPGDPTALDTLPAGELREMGIAFAQAMLDPAALTSRALHLGGFQNSHFNTAPFHAAELPFGNGIGDARSLARLYAACIGEVDGFRLLSEETLDQATQEQGFRPDAVLFYPTRWSNGFMLPTEVVPWLGPTSFGFTGAGGHLGFGDREHGVGFAYTMTKMFGNLTGDPRPASVIDALKKCLD
jgi:CubicO group peptidase (beta-lactamase class C family)